MASKKGFTLFEMIVVLIVVGLLAALTIPSFIASSEVTKAQMAQNNLYAISAAEQKYSEDHSGAYINPGDANSNADINTNLGLSISDSFGYNCSSFAGDLYQCTATDGTDKLYLNVTTASGAVVTCTNLAGNAGYCP